MSKKPENPSAFPKSGNYRLGHNGMSLRDYFAGQAVTGFFAANSNEDEMPPARVLASIAYEAADAMLAERAKTEGK